MADGAEMDPKELPTGSVDSENMEGDTVRYGISLPYDLPYALRARGATGMVGKTLPFRIGEEVFEANVVEAYASARENAIVLTVELPYHPLVSEKFAPKDFSVDNN